MIFQRLGLICVMICVVVLIPTGVDAQFALGVGRALPLGDFEEETTTGWAAQGTFGFAVPVLPVRLRADLLYHSFGNAEREPSLYARVGGEWFKQLGFVLNVTHSIPFDVVTPYGALGVGLIREWHGDYSHSGTRHNNVRINAAVGLEVPIAGNRALFVETRQLFGGKALPLTLPATQPEVKFQSIPIMIGVRF